MLRSIGLHQGFHVNHLKDVELELKNLRAEQENHHEIAMVRTEGPHASSYRAASSNAPLMALISVSVAVVSESDALGFSARTLTT
jgi:hypothetical protein